MRPPADLIELIVHRVEVADARLLVVEDFDDLLAVHHLLCEAFHRAGCLLLFHEVLGRSAADRFRHIEHGDNAQNQHQCQPDAEIKHDGKHHQHHGTGLDQRRQRLRNQLTEGVDIIGIMGHDIPVLVRIEVGDREILHPVEQFTPHPVQEALRHESHDLCIGDHRQQRQRI